MQEWVFACLKSESASIVLAALLACMNLSKLLSRKRPASTSKLHPQTNYQKQERPREGSWFAPGAFTSSRGSGGCHM